MYKSLCLIIKELKVLQKQKKNKRQGVNHSKMISYATPYLYQYRAAHVLKDPRMRCLTYIAYLFRYKGILVLDSLDYKTRQNSSIRFTSFPYRLLIGHLLQELRNPFYSHIRNRRLLNRNIIFLS